MRLTLPILSLLISLSILPSAIANPVSGQGTWESTLLPRDLDGDPTSIDAYYDTALDITWSVTAYWASTGNWDVANAIATQNPGWRLPRTLPVDGTIADDHIFSELGDEDRGYNISAPYQEYLAHLGFGGSTASELAHMFYNTLGNSALQAVSWATIPAGQPEWGLTNTGPFFNLSPELYWSESEYAPDPTLHWFFDFSDGLQDGPTHELDDRIVWPVIDGDVGEPIPTVSATQTPEIPGVQLFAAVPNPFNPSTTIRFHLPIEATASLRIYDVSGRLVRSLIHGEQLEQGDHHRTWLGFDDAGRLAAAGVYFYRLDAGSTVQARRVTLVK